MGNKGRLWTEDEVNYLKDSYDDLSYEEMSEKLKRTVNAIKLKANRIGLERYLTSDKYGYSICKKCKRELPRTNIYYPSDKTCIDGFRSVCRECSKDGHFMSEDYIPKIIWTKAENDLFIDRYPNYTSEELIDNFYNDYNEKQLWDRADRLRREHNIKLEKTKESIDRANIQRSIKTSEALTGREFSDEHRNNISKSRIEYFKTHKSHWLGRKLSKEEKQNISDRNKGKWSGKNNPRYKNPLFGENNGRWKGGVKPIYFYLRDSLSEWKDDSMKRCNYKCILTDGEFNEIHHLYSFKKIVDELFIDLNMELKSEIGEYLESELILLKERLLEIHYDYPLGVCLSKSTHKEFHDLYGYTDFLIEDFYEFAFTYYNVDVEEKLNLK